MNAKIINLKTLTTVFIGLWFISAAIVLCYGNLDKANQFGGSFGAISALFSGLALALAIYSMVLQQKQNEEFEKNTLSIFEQQSRALQQQSDALKQQSFTIKSIESGIAEQAGIARITILLSLISHEDQRIENLTRWGESLGDKDKYKNGINAAKEKIKQYEKEIKEFTNKQ